MFFIPILDTQKSVPPFPLFPKRPKANSQTQVGGLPLAELNHLELQFLLLNDFRLSVPVEELEAYGTMLVEFYAREVIAQRQGSVPMDLAFPEDKDMTGIASP
jgi:hypothetical protein